jgi:periplasmic protein TonB
VIIATHPLLRDKRVTRAAVMAVVVAAHVGVFAVAGRPGPPGDNLPPAPPILLELVRPPVPPPPPPPPVEPSARPGGGAPAAPSRVHIPPPPKVPVPDPPPAPVVQAPEPAIVVGVAPTASDQPGMGLGGQGTGTGTGVGSGDGPGSGSRPMIIRGASQREIFAATPPEIRRRGIPAEARVNCEIRGDSRLVDCRVVEETPAGLGFGPAAIRIAEESFRFRPPRNASGDAVAGVRVTVVVSVGRR